MNHLDQWRAKLAELFPPSNIEDEFDIGAAIFKAYELGEIGPLTIRLRGTRETPRRYLGASSLGNECLRKTWAQWRNIGDGPPGRIRRLFKTGDVYEARMRHELEAIGFTMYGDQSRFEAFGGRVAGHDDGFATIADLPPALWEAKTANHKRSTEIRRHVRKDGGSEGLKQWDRKYWAQAHAYMAAFGVQVCLFEVTDKDNDDVFAFLFELDRDAVRDTGRRARKLLDAETVPPRGYKREKSPECTRLCDCAEWCWQREEIPRVCGACVFWRDGICTRTGAPAEAPCDEFVAVPRPPNESAVDEWEAL